MLEVLVKEGNILAEMVLDTELLPLDMEPPQLDMELVLLQDMLPPPEDMGLLVIVMVILLEVIS